MNDDEKVFDETMQMLSSLYDELIAECIMALEKLTAADLSDKKTLIRIVLRGMCDVDTPQEACTVDFWVDKAEYLNDSSFILHVTQAEPNVFWNIEKKGQIPGRMEVKRQMTIRKGTMYQPPYIPVSNLFILHMKLLAMSYPDMHSSEILTKYFDEADHIVTAHAITDFFELDNTEPLS